MVEKLLTKLKGYYSKKSNNDTAEKLRKAEKEIADQKQIIYEMRKEMPCGSDFAQGALTYDSARPEIVLNPKP